MNVEEKKVNSRQFIISSEFTPAAHTTLALFNRNVQNLSYVFNLEGILLDKIQKGELDTGLTVEAQLEAKNFILLDGLAKIMMIAEGFFALSEALSNPAKGYKDLAKSMAYYRSRDVNGFIERFKRRHVHLWNLFRFPDTKKLRLEPKETAFIERLLSDSCKLLEKTLVEIIAFYECNRIAYNKLKHGLSFLAGMKLTPKDGPHEQEYPQALIYALDRWGSMEPPCLCHKSKEPFMPEAYEWYDTVSMIPYWQNTFKKYSDIMINLVLMVEHLVQNHLDWASNCGEDYFPLKWMSERQYRPILYLPYKLEGAEKDLYEQTVNKIISNMNVADKIYKFDINIPNEVMNKIFACFASNQVATLWGPSNKKSSATVRVE